MSKQRKTVGWVLRWHNAPTDGLDYYGPPANGGNYSIVRRSQAAVYATRAAALDAIDGDSYFWRAVRRTKRVPKPAATPAPAKLESVPIVYLTRPGTYTITWSR